MKNQDEQNAENADWNADNETFPGDRAEYLEASEPEEFEEYDDYYDHDDMFDTDSALGSAGFGTDEYYG